MQYGCSSPRAFGTPNFGQKRSPMKVKETLNRPFGSDTGKRGWSKIEVLPDSYSGEIGVAVRQTWQCTVCGTTFNRKTTFQAHKKMHLGQFRYHCEVCGKGFMGIGDLKGHMAVHTKKKDFCCPVCSKLFAYKQSFRAHLRDIHHIKDDTELAQITASAKLVSDLKTKYAP